MPDNNWTLISGSTPQDYTDTAVFEVDPDTKQIALITGQALVAGEKDSQYISFLMPRYWDGIDISSKTFAIEYALAGTYYGTSEAVNAEMTTEQVRFGWIVPETACAISGTLLFVLKITSEGYTLKTQIAEHPVFKTINVEDVVPEPTKEAWYRAFQTRVDSAISEAETAVETAQTTLTEVETSARLAEAAAQNAQAAQETVEAASQSAQTSAQVAQVSQEAAEAAAQTASNKATEAQGYAQNAEGARDDALTAQAAAETAQMGAETAQTGAESAKSAAEGARNSAQTYANSAQAYAEQANQRNNIAAGYATANKALTTDYTIIPMGADYVLGSNFTRVSDGGYRAGKSGTVMVSAGCNMDGFTSGDTVMACIGKYNSGWQFTSVGHFPSIIGAGGSCDIVGHVITVNQGDVIYLRARNTNAARGNVTSARLIVQYI